MPSSPIVNRRSRRRRPNVTIPSVKAKVDKLVNITQEKIKYLQDSHVTTENGLRTKVLLESALKKLNNNEVSVHSPPAFRSSLYINIPPSSPRKRSINESIGSSSPPSPASSPIPSYMRHNTGTSSPEPDAGDETTSSVLSDSIKRMKLINQQLAEDGAAAAAACFCYD